MDDDTLELVLRGRSPLIEGHLVNGERVFPGLAYLDLLLRSAWQKKGLSHSSHCLKRLAIVHPLIVGASDTIRLRVSFSRIANGWLIQVAGSPSKGEGESSEDRMYATAELVAEQTSLPRRIDIPSLVAQSQERVDLSAVYAKAQRSGLSHSGLIRAIGQVHLLSNGGLIDIEVDSRYAKGSNEILCHPTLVDGAAMASAVLGDSSRRRRTEDLFVPLAYDYFYLAHPLGRRCYATIDLSTFKSVNDICKLDIDFFDEHGQQAAVLKGLTAKQVRSGPQIAAALSRSKSTARTQQRVAGPADESSMQEMLRNVFARYLKEDGALIDADTAFYELGFQSADLVRMLSDIESRLGVRLAPSLLFEYSTLRELGAFLSAEGCPASAAESGAEHSYRSLKPVSYESTHIPAAAKEPSKLDADVFAAGDSDPLVHFALAISRLSSKPGIAPAYEVRDASFHYRFPSLAAPAGHDVKVALSPHAGPLGFVTIPLIDNSNVALASSTARSVVDCQQRREPIQLDKLLERGKGVDADAMNRACDLLADAVGCVRTASIDACYRCADGMLISRVDLLPKGGKRDMAMWLLIPLLQSVFDQGLIMFVEDAGASGTESTRTYVPSGIEQLRIYRSVDSIAYLVSKSRFRSPHFIALDTYVLSERGEVIAEIDNASVKAVDLPGVAPRAEPKAAPESTNIISPMLRAAARGANDTAADGNLGIEGRVLAFLRERVAEQLQIAAIEIPTHASFFELGLSSLGIVKLTRQIEQVVDEALSPTLMLEFDCIAALSQYLAKRYSGKCENVRASASAESDEDAASSEDPYEQEPCVSSNVLSILENLRSGLLTPGRAQELMDKE